MGRILIDNLADLILHNCPLGCTKCARIWINDITGHRIVCKCDCRHEKMAPGVEEPVANAIHSPCSKEGIHET